MLEVLKYLIPAGIAFIGVLLSQWNSNRMLKKSWAHERDIRESETHEAERVRQESKVKELKQWNNDKFLSALDELMKAYHERLYREERRLFSEKPYQPSESFTEHSEQYSEANTHSDIQIRVATQRALFLCPEAIVDELITLQRCWDTSISADPAPGRFTVFDVQLERFTLYLRSEMLDLDSPQIDKPHPQSCAGNIDAFIEKLRPRNDS